MPQFGRLLTGNNCVNVVHSYCVVVLFERASETPFPPYRPWAERNSQLTILMTSQPEGKHQLNCIIKLPDIKCPCVFTRLVKPVSQCCFPGTTSLHLEAVLSGRNGYIISKMTDPSFHTLKHSHTKHLSSTVVNPYTEKDSTVPWCT